MLYVSLQSYTAACYLLFGPFLLQKKFIISFRLGPASKAVLGRVVGGGHLPNAEMLSKNAGPILPFLQTFKRMILRIFSPNSFYIWPFLLAHLLLHIFLHLFHIMQPKRLTTLAGQYKK